MVTSRKVHYRAFLFYVGRTGRPVTIESAIEPTVEGGFLRYRDAEPSDRVIRYISLDGVAHFNVETRWVDIYTTENE